MPDVHEEQRVAGGVGAIVTVLLVGRRGPVGAITVEWPPAAASAAADAVPLLETAALLCGPSFDDKLEHPRDCQGRDQQLEPVLASEISEAIHALNVLQERVRRLLPE